MDKCDGGQPNSLRADPLGLTLTCLGELVAWHETYHAEFLDEWAELYRLGDRLGNPVWQISVLGQVSRGKSALLNALYGEPVFPVGPLHGVTQWPRTVRWQVRIGEQHYPVDLTDTPGLDEVAGNQQAEMAWATTEAADLILFVTAGPLGDRELEALGQLQGQNLPLFLVANKQDLYPDWTAEKLTQQMTTAGLASILQYQLPIFLTTQKTNPPHPGLESLNCAIATWVQQDAPHRRARHILERAIALEKKLGSALGEAKTPVLHQRLVPLLGFQVGLVMICPWNGLDILWGLLGYLLLIRRLCQGYAIPLPLHQAKTLMSTMFFALSLLYLVGWGEHFFSLPGETQGFWSASFLQAGIVAWGHVQLRRRLESYLRQGYLWGRQGPEKLLSLMEPEIRP
ncbi:Era-like GTP-binding protein [Candidatus Synechococcus calcipolaris G9]|uniref:Era-like GTP-binding protein n=1 Tax=Candidatus Synechococcus calcipolaris G9 TaxID=1497997 RepID=A0ABT6F2Q6_9SYNE|nr:Era-like GTP-binding protein [Candidatus Synechococcus calcipolaris]MDG2992068.1 Era-like GTP-binding protein [Candidatus Synechococcus calcipolaris G9]